MAILFLFGRVMLGLIQLLSLHTQTSLTYKQPPVCLIPTSLPSEFWSFFCALRPIKLILAYAHDGAADCMYVTLFSCLLQSVPLFLPP